MSRRPGRKGQERGPEEASAWLTANRGAFAAWPKIEVLPDQYGFRVRGKVKRPEGREETQWGAYVALFFVGGFIGGFTGGIVFGDGPENNAATIGWWVGSISLLVGIALWRAYGNKATIDVIVTPEKIGIGRTLKYEWIERRFGAAFEVVRPHSKAYEDEVEGIKIGPKQRAVYAKSDEVILMSGARRVVVAEIFNDKRRTEKLHMTLFILNQAVN